MNHIVDMRYKNNIKKNEVNFYNLKIEMNKTLREGAIIPNFEPMYDLILKAINKKKEGKSYFKLFDINIRNTISINSPHYENLNYKQTNIFNDPIHEEMIRHESSLPMNLIKMDFINLHLDYIEMNYLGVVKNNMNKESNISSTNNNLVTNTTNNLNSLNNNHLTVNNINNNNNPTIINNTTNNINNNFNNLLNIQNSGTKDENTNNNNKNMDNQIFNINIGNSNENNNIPVNKNMMKDFKKLFFQNKDIVYHFYNYTSIKNRKQLTIEFSKNKELDDFNNGNSRRPSIQNNKNLMSKEEYIKNYNKNYYKIISNNNSKIEFNISFGANIVQTISLCEICGKPNTLWDIRKEFQFSKNKKETKTKCKYCNMLYVPYFYALDDPGLIPEKIIFSGNNINVLEKNLSNKNKKTILNTANLNNKSFDDKNDINNHSISEYQNYNNHNQISEKIESVSNYTKIDLTKNKIIKVEYMSFEHLLYIYVENEIHMNTEKDNTLYLNNKNKRLSNLINFMANLLKGELKLRIENNRFIYFSIDEYIKKLFVNMFTNENNFLNSQELGNNLNQGQYKENQKKNNITLAKLLKEIIEKKKREVEEDKEKKLKQIEGKKKQNKKLKENKVLNIKFDIKDLIFDKKFEYFSKELQALTIINSKNKLNDNILTMSKEKENNNFTCKNTDQESKYLCSMFCIFLLMNN